MLAQLTHESTCRWNRWNSLRCKCYNIYKTKITVVSSTLHNIVEDLKAVQRATLPYPTFHVQQHVATPWGNHAIRSLLKAAEAECNTLTVQRRRLIYQNITVYRYSCVCVRVLARARVYISFMYTVSRYQENRLMLLSMCRSKCRLLSNNNLYN